MPSRRIAGDNLAARLPVRRLIGHAAIREQVQAILRMKKAVLQPAPYDHVRAKIARLQQGGDPGFSIFSPVVAACRSDCSARASQSWQALIPTRMRPQAMPSISIRAPPSTPCLAT